MEPWIEDLLYRNEPAEILQQPHKADDLVEKLLLAQNSGKNFFNQEKDDYDYLSAIKAGMGPDGTGDNAGHWGSVSPTTLAEIYMMLKGTQHQTWNKGVWGEYLRGSKTQKIGDRYYSLPQNTPTFR